jgi:hypothetical protein
VRARFGRCACCGLRAFASTRGQLISQSRHPALIFAALRVLDLAGRAFLQGVDPVLARLLGELAHGVDAELRACFPRRVRRSRRPLRQRDAYRAGQWASFQGSGGVAGSLLLSQSSPAGALSAASSSRSSRSCIRISRSSFHEIPAAIARARPWV